MPKSRLAGSSPLAWGQPPSARICGRGPRVIPTRVGSTRCRRRPCRPCSGHPHSRGVNTYGAMKDRFNPGSSPLAWGQPNGSLNVLRLMRVIPTRVGSTPSVWERTGTKSGHPHSRGVNRYGRSMLADDGGSSPLAWGQPCPTSSKRILIPGHPHSRGVNL